MIKILIVLILNHKYHIDTFIRKEKVKIFMFVILKMKIRNKKVSTFFKFSPLMDPVKYMAGKYKKNNINILPFLR